MSLRNKIFLRISLLIFSLILCICIAGSILEVLYHHDEDLTTMTGPAIRVIFGFGLLGFLPSLFLAMGIANRTSAEVETLTGKLNDYSLKLESTVAERTAVLQRNEHIISSTTDHMAFIDANYIYREVNQSYLDSFGKPKDQIVGKTIAQVFGEELFNNRIKINFDKCLAGEKISYQAWFEFPVAGRSLMDVSYIPYTNKDGQVSGAVISSHDVTTLLHAEDKLRESEERFHSLFSGVGIGVAIYSAIDNGDDFVFLDYNRAGREMDGVTLADSIGFKVTDVFPGVVEFGMLDVMRRVWLTGVPEEHPVSIYKNQEVSFWRHNSLFKLPSGELVAVYTDETAKMQAEQSLQEQHARFVAVMDSLDAAVYVADMQTHELLFINKQIRELFGDVAGKPCWQKIQSGQSGPCSFCTNDHLIDADGQPTEPYIWEFQNTEDKQWYQCHDQAILWPDGRLVRLEIATNISMRKASEDATNLQGQFLKSLGDARQVLLQSAEVVPFQEFLNHVGPVANARRLFLFLNHRGDDGNLMLNQQAIWSADSENNDIDSLLMQNISYNKWLPNWQKTLKNGVAIVKHINDLSDPEQGVLKSQNIQTVALVPVMIDHEFVGFIGFENCLSHTIWSTVEITYFEAVAFDLAQAIKRVRSENNLRNSLKDKEVLMREIHHRVKNNMQVVTSLLDLQSRKISDQHALQAIKESQDRIRVMSLVHETLYRSDDLQCIAMKDYFTRLIDDLSRLHTTAGQQIQCLVSVDEVTLSVNDAIPVGLIANELLTNAFKHAFAGRQSGCVRVVLQAIKDHKLELMVADDGVGISEDLNCQEPETLGMQLVNRLAEGQLGGTLDVQNEGGARFSLRFKPS